MKKTLKTTIMAVAVAATAMTVLLTGGSVEAKAKAINKTVVSGQTISLTQYTKKLGKVKAWPAAYNAAGRTYHRVGAAKVEVMYPSTLRFKCKKGTLTVKVKAKTAATKPIKVVAGKTATIKLSGKDSKKIGGSREYRKSSNTSIVTTPVVTYANGSDTPTVKVRGKKAGSALVTVRLSKGVTFKTKVIVTKAKTSGTTKVTDDTATSQKVTSDVDAKPATKDTDTAAKAEEEAEAEAAKQAEEEAARRAAEEAAAKQAAEEEAAKKAEEEAAAKAEAEAAMKAEEEEAARRAAEEAAAEAEAARQAAIARFQEDRVMAVGETVEVEIPDGFFYTSTEGRYGVVSVEIIGSNLRITANKWGTAYPTLANADGTVIQTAVCVTK